MIQPTCVKHDSHKGFVNLRYLNITHGNKMLIFMCKTSQRDINHTNQEHINLHYQFSVLALTNTTYHYHAN